MTRNYFANQQNRHVLKPGLETEDGDRDGDRDGDWIKTIEREIIIQIITIHSAVTRRFIALHHRSMIRRNIQR